MSNSSYIIIGEIQFFLLLMTRGLDYVRPSHINIGVFARHGGLATRV